ncbi:hypothetical protein [Paralysiella testudinis]|uniref:Lipoprotein n=1 Tax=Paralysiella testudinis TaxID=2809020 RepID=A0A892ZFQ6_9NEIS|nr:hypothetical protein [Paralysiella testudinis]QRQ80687.1 hypothetical protein JQU52_07875 [Paralysiella testudinis]
MRIFLTVIVLALSACTMTSFDGRDFFDVRKPAAEEKQQAQAAINQELSQETTEQLAQRVYLDAKNKYEGRFLDKCTFISQVKKQGTEVVIVHLLHDDRCGNQTHQMTTQQIRQLSERLRVSRIHEIKQSPHAVLAIRKGVIQTYEYYLLPENKLIAKESISKKDFE